MSNQEQAIRIDCEAYDKVIEGINKISEVLESINPCFSNDILLKQFDIITQKMFLYRYSLKGQLSKKDTVIIKNAVAHDLLLEYYNQYKDFEPIKFVTWDSLTKLSSKGLKLVVNEISYSINAIEDEFTFYLALFEAKHPNETLFGVNLTAAVLIGGSLAIINEYDHLSDAETAAILNMCQNNLSTRFNAYYMHITGRTYN